MVTRVLVIFVLRTHAALGGVAVMYLASAEIAKRLLAERRTHRQALRA